MFLNPWSLALSLVSFSALVLITIACRSAVRVLRYWNPDSDSNRQIQLEGEIWLVSTLVEYGLLFQISSLVLFIFAADNFCEVIVGAMCATGALLANQFGMPSLLIKLLGVFLYGFWIVLHQLDIRAETYPLVKTKYIYLLLLLPLLITDIALQTFYLAGLSPDIITSCCAVVFGEGAEQGSNLLGSFNQPLLLSFFYGSIAVLIILGILVSRTRSSLTAILQAVGWTFFIALALVTVISVISSYIYAMPFHHCPFCIIKPEYHYIGLAIYFTLIPATFFGMVPALIIPCKQKPELISSVGSFQSVSAKLSVLLLILFTILSSYHMIAYRVLGGEM